MTIGILTFHWATNYGAVLQAYALQLFLSRLGHDVRIIDYMPRRFIKSFAGCFASKRPRAIKRALAEYVKEKQFITFRKKHLKLTSRYFSLQEMRMNPPKYDVYICGSDQIWNMWFVMNGEGRITTSYFLDFGSKMTTRIAYAVSFGCTEYSNQVQRIVAPLLKNFIAISMREETGCDIVRSMGFDNVALMPDPALLLSSKEYDKLITCTASRKSPFIFFYLIHNRQNTATQMESYFRDTLREHIVSTKQYRYSFIGVPEWLFLIKNSKFIVTNSFHGVVFSIIYKKDFIAIPVEGPSVGMNDRIFTLLKQVNLQDRVLSNCDTSRISNLLLKPIIWDNVEIIIHALRKEAEIFLANALKSNNGAYSD